MNGSASRWVDGLLALAFMAGLCGCEQLFDRGVSKNIELAEKRTAAGDFASAIRLYEASLDGGAKTADLHYKLAVIYADKLKQPVDALHHFARYLELSPNGLHAKEARDYSKEGIDQFLAAQIKGPPVSQEEAARLRNENFRLSNQIVELKKQRYIPPLPAGAKKGETRQRPVPPGARTYTVERGDTLATIAGKVYKNKARWKSIEEANFYPQKGTPKLNPGMVLVIP